LSPPDYEFSTAFKLLELLKQIAPQMTGAAVLWNPAMHHDQLSAIEAVAVPGLEPHSGTRVKLPPSRPLPRKGGAAAFGGEASDTQRS
jgi:hypothetical protein